MSKLVYNSVVITTGSGVVLFKQNNPSIGVNSSVYNKSINLFNSMITSTYVNFSPSKAAAPESEESQHVQTYSRNQEVLKYIDLFSKGVIFVSVSYSSISAKTADANRILQFLVHLKDLFLTIVIEDMYGKDVSGETLLGQLDAIKVKSAVSSMKFNVYVEQLVAKIESNDLNLHVDSSDEEESEVEEKPKEIVKKKAVSKTKKGRKWTDDGGFVEDHGGNDVLDFTEDNDKASAEENDDVSKLVSNVNYGQKTKEGFVINDLSQEIDTILSSSANKSKSKNTAAKGGAFGFLLKYIGGKTITDQDLEKSSKIIKENLIKKNVSAEIAEKLVLSLKPSLLGSKTKNFTSVESQIKSSLQLELTKILTPNTSIDLLHEIYQKQAKAAKKNTNDPYVISIVGVNGVGKSTNLSKLAYWLLNNKFNVLIAACDTFRSGAVEQLKVHERNLNKLITSLKLDSKLQVFEQGYGNLSKVSLIAKNSIQYAKDHGFDIILMDTAGRRHNDSKLMAPLKDFAVAAKPDKIIMVGEALVGTDSVMQAANFNKSFAGANRQIDFFIISKCDTVGDLIGTMVNMVYSTGIPILFVGVGQTYTDLRTLSVEWAVDTLLS